nr:aminoacyl-histidine dipeptidase [Clostridia bacterium]
MLNIPEHPDCEAIFRHFESFSKIPHGSGNTAAIANFFVEFARDRGLEYYRDEADNVVIRKPATKGYEDRPAIIFQGHLDMVAEKKTGAPIDMEKEGLTLYRDGDYIRAKDTTLGGDDGVALAYAMAVLDSEDIPHPDFEAVFTSDEEIGLLGAVALAPEAVKGRLLINIDSDAEGIFTVGCAGGMRSDISLPVRYESAESGTAYKVRLHGFKGGHSGVEIDKGRANATKVLAEILNVIPDIRIASISGGNADNAIPRECEAIVLADSDFPERLRDVFAMRLDMAAVLTNLPAVDTEASESKPQSLRKTEHDATLDTERAASPESTLDRESTEKLLSLLVLLPSGVIAMSKELEGLVETSLNLGILRLDSEAHISFSVRSSKGEEKRRLGDLLSALAQSFGAGYAERGDYPAWEYRPASHLREVMKSVYENMYGKSPEIVTIHAGLECGIFTEKLPDVDCVSIGPDNLDIHTTEERLSIPSFVRVWKYLLEVLKNI